MSTQATGTIAVFGATGQQGGAVVDALLARGAEVRALVRAPESDRARALAARGVELSAIRIDDPASLAAALEAVDAFYFMTPESHSPQETEDEIRLGTALIDAAVAARVPHVVFNSVSGAEHDSGVSHFESKGRVEERLRRSGLRAVVVRPVAFMESFAMLPPTVEDGEIVLRMPVPDGVRLKLVAVKDIGLVAAAILLGTADVPGGAVEVIGDELTGSQIAAAFGAHAGLPARYEALPLSVLGGDPEEEAMFRWFAEGSAYPSDLAAVRAIVPTTWDLAEWIRSTGWTAPTDLVPS
ncbi:NmrA/HSCARG family protein [Umezawaea sp. Da 62-37]|uniref:NmrA/HSCARG family protein n=1 Tax=Umezawaea sp. Da 62-37 TaxID=3075927 RepID=UPI0028F6F74E|nr:NmrA/HSCARG family protein [Umezawaea sp. Da 62-37]WNV87048.1 NmrA/HSCARG family protein [Umezawaea sp. Da 62-37]